MAPSESQRPDESGRTRGAGGDIQSKGLTDADDAGSREESVGDAQEEATGGTRAGED